MPARLSHVERAAPMSTATMTWALPVMTTAAASLLGNNTYNSDSKMLLVLLTVAVVHETHGTTGAVKYLDWYFRNQNRFVQRACVYSTTT